MKPDLANMARAVAYCGMHGVRLAQWRRQGAPGLRYGLDGDVAKRDTIQLVIALEEMRARFLR